MGQQWYNSKYYNKWLWTWNRWKWCNETFNQNVWHSKAMVENFKWRKHMNSLKMTKSTWNSTMWLTKLTTLKIIPTQMTSEAKHWFNDTTVIWWHMPTKHQMNTGYVENFKMTIDECKLQCQLIKWILWYRFSCVCWISFPEKTQSQHPKCHYQFVIHCAVPKNTHTFA